MIDNINKLKAELIAHKYKMIGCTESEILEIEANYGKLPFSYRQIIALIGHNGIFLAGDEWFYISIESYIEQFIDENKEFRRYRKETVENDLVDDDLLKIPEDIFIISSWDGNDYFVLTNKTEYKEDSPVYVYKDFGTVKKECSSVWKWINQIMTTSIWY